jgi:hypothetical protein
MFKNCNAMKKFKIDPRSFKVGDQVYRTSYLEYGLYTIKEIIDGSDDGPIRFMLTANDRPYTDDYRADKIYPKDLVESLKVGSVVFEYEDGMPYYITDVNFSSGFISASTDRGNTEHIHPGWYFTNEVAEVVTAHTSDFRSTHQLPLVLCKRIMFGEHEGKYIHARHTRILASTIVVDDQEVDYHILHDGYMRYIDDDMLYHEDTFDEHNLIVCDAGSRAGQLIDVGDAMYVEGEGYYHTCDDGDLFHWSDRRDCYVLGGTSDGDRHGYHSGIRRDYSDNAKFCFGVEVEKEDEEPLGAYDLTDCDDTGWSREEDGSLDSESGYELVSPKYDLFGDRFDNDLKDPILRDHINADFSDSCGGHMSFSIHGHDGNGTYDRVSGFAPVILALYNGRARNTYSRAHRDYKHAKQNGYRAAININSGYVEFRVFSAVRNVTNLLWRRDLLRIMANNLDKSSLYFVRQLLDESSELHQHLRKVYADREKVYRIAAYTAAFAEEMTGKSYMRFVSKVDKSNRDNIKSSVSRLFS